MSNRGHDRERDVGDLLEAFGWWVARAAGSLGDADLVANRRLLVAISEPLTVCRSMLVEVKSTKAGPFADFPPADRLDLLKAADMAGAEAWLAWVPPTLKGARGVGDFNGYWGAWIPSKDWPPLG